MSQEREKTLILPSRTLEFLGGYLISRQLDEGKVILVEGPFLWGVDPLELGKGVLNHSLLVGRGAWYMARALKTRSEELGDGRFTDESLDEMITAEAGVVHDPNKLAHGKAYLPEIALGLEDLTTEGKKHLGFSPDFLEISPEADEIVAGWLRKADFPPEIIEAVAGHDFPEDEKEADTIYEKILIWADYSCGQSFTPARDRLNDVFERWILKAVTNQETLPADKDPTELVCDHWQELQFVPDSPPRIEPERAAKAARIIEKTTAELFSYLGTTEQEFIETHQLNNDSSMMAWERVLRNAWESDYAYQQAGGRGAPRSNRVEEIIANDGF
jgi:hypothetical protein